MKKPFALLMICLFAVSWASAQDWQADDELTARYNCDLVHALIEDYGDQNILQTAPNSFVSLSNFLDSLFPKCLERQIDDDAAALAATQTETAINESGDVLAVLEEGEMQVFREYCTIMITDEPVRDISVYVASHYHESIAVDVYLPGEIEAAEVVHKSTETVQGLPIRLDHIKAEQYPNGRYTFDVRVNEDTFRFQWQRNDPDDATLMLSCPGEDPTILSQIEAELLQDIDEAAADSEPATAADAPGEGEVFAVLEIDSLQVLNADCTVWITDQFDTGFNVTITGNGQDSMFVDVYLPGESQPAAVRDVLEDKLELDIPMRIEWIEGNQFPLGVYIFDAQVGEESYRFEWTRQDENDYTFVLNCLRVQDFEGALARLEDGDSYKFEDIGCEIFTDDWDADLNIVVTARAPEAIVVDVVFPGDSHPKATDGVQRDEFDDGTKYRLEWIKGESFPLGTYTIVVHVDGSSYLVAWDREDLTYNTIFVHCQGNEDDAKY